MNWTKNKKIKFCITNSLFHEKYLVLNAGEYHYICLGRNTENVVHNFSDKTYANSEKEIKLGMKLDNKLSL